MLPAAVAVALLAAFGPAVSAGLDWSGREALAAPRFAWTTPLGCTASPLPAAEPGTQSVRFTCPQGVLEATAQVFPRRTNPAAIIAARRRVSEEMSAEDVVTSTLEVDGLALPRWRFTAASTEKGTVATAQALMVDGAPARDGLAGRIALARDSVLGGTTRPVLLAVTHRSPRPQFGAEEDRRLRLFLTTFLQVQSNLTAELAKAGGG
jgi:hypothetical protein